MYVKGTLLKGINMACVASASVWFRSNERPRRNGIFWFWPREKWNEGLPALLLAPFFAPAVFDSRSSLFAPKPNGNVYYTS